MASLDQVMASRLTGTDLLPKLILQDRQLPFFISIYYHHVSCEVVSYWIFFIISAPGNERYIAISRWKIEIRQDLNFLHLIKMWHPMRCYIK